MATYNTTIGRVYSSPHSNNCWAWLDAIGQWRPVLGSSTDGVTNVHLILTQARNSGATVTVSTDDTPSTQFAITNVYL